MHHQNSTLKIASSYVNKYPKFLLLFITFLIAYLLFSGRTNPKFHLFVVSLGFLGTFLTGILFTYGFTAAPATAIFLILAKEQNIMLTGLVGGLGALLGDLLIFNFIRHSFKDEVKKLYREKIIVYTNHKTPSFLKRYLLSVVAGFIIASPLPDEIAVTMLAASKSVSTKAFLIISYVLNTLGILVVLMIGSSI
jgi:uncharacterized membrane protein YdjX (TVP38/TMEM64 family)